MRWFILLCLALLVALVPAWAVQNWYVDHTMTGGADTGVDLANAWLTIVKAVEAAHDPGDTIFIRDTHVETLGSIADVLSGGTPSAYIVLMGDDGEREGGGTRIWAASTSTVMITCGAHYIHSVMDDHWNIDNLHFLGYSVRAAYIQMADGWAFSNCTFEQPVGADIGIELYISDCIVSGCVFDGNTIGAPGANAGTGVYTNGSIAYIDNCAFDDLTNGISAGAGPSYITNCDFGCTESNTNDVIINGVTAAAAILSGNLSDNGKLVTSSGYPLSSYISRLYADASNRPMVYRESYSWNTITDYLTVHSGGADYSLKVMTNVAAAGLYAPIKVLEYGAHCDSADAKDWTIYAQRNAAWGTAPTAAQFYLEATYIESSVSTATVVSTATMASESTWYPLTASAVTPVHDGPVMLTLWLKTTDADGAIYVDPRPITDTSETYHEYSLWGMPLASLHEAMFGGQVIILN